MHNKEHESKSIRTNYFVRSETNQRENNEDSFLIYQLKNAHHTIKLLTIADGMGGHAYGERVSRAALHKISMALFEQVCIEPALNQDPPLAVIEREAMEQTLWNALEQANNFIQLMVRNNHWGKAGSTVVAAAILDNTVVSTNLGDSPLFHYKKRSQQLRKITHDHTVAGVLLRGGMITPEMALHHEGRNRLEFFLGAEKLPPQAQIYQLALEPGDLLLLCTDGVSAALLPEQMEKIVAATDNDPNYIIDKLFNAARETGETDNQTAIIWQQGGYMEEKTEKDTRHHSPLILHAVPNFIPSLTKERTHHNPPHDDSSSSVPEETKRPEGE